MLIYRIQSGKTVLEEGQSFSPSAEARAFRIPVGRVLTSEGLTLRISLPAVSEDDLAFSVYMGGLVLMGHRREPRRFQRSFAKQLALPYGKFYRRIRFSREFDISRLSGTFHHGVLDLHIPFLAQAVEVPIAVPLPRLVDEEACALTS